MKSTLLAIILLISGCMTSGTGNLSAVPGPTLKVLSLNLCADYTSPRKDRADKVIQLCKTEQVDIILTQEGAKGLGQFDAVKYIAGELGYSYSQAPAFGVSGFMEYCVGVISKYSLSSSKAVGCQVTGGDPIDRVPFPGASRGLLVNTAGVWVMSSHLTVPVTQESRVEQVQCLFGALPAGVAVWGGDFNFDRNNPAYSIIRLQEALYSGPPLVDMVFYNGLSVLDSRLVFEDRVVSDHAGVLVTFGR